MSRSVEHRKLSPASSALAIIMALTVIGAPFVVGSSAGEPSEETVLRMGFVDMVESLNPNIGLNEVSWIFYGLVYDCLQSVNEGLAPSPNLAIGWGVAEDFEPYGSVWDYNLTRNAHWHDGQPLTADDVVFTLNLNAEHYTTMWAYQPYSYFMEYAEKLDDHTVRVHFFDRFTDEPMPIAFGSLLPIHVLPEHLLRSYSATEISFNWDGLFHDSEPPLVGTGPFMATQDIYQEFLVGDKLTLVRNPYYHWAQDRLETVKFDKLEMHFFDDATAMTLALEIGDLDVVQLPTQELADYIALKDKVTNGQLENITAYDGLKCTQHWTSVLINQNTFGPNPSRLDPIIRQAMAIATDKEYINDNFYLGLGEPGTTMISPVNEKWHYEPIGGETYDFDIAAANALLEDAGYRYVDGSTTRLCTADSWAVQENLVPEDYPLTYQMGVRQEHPEEADIARYLQSEWEKIGIGLDYTIMSEAALGAYVYSYAYDTAIWYWASDPDPSYILFCMSENSWNGWNDNMYSTYEYEENFTASIQEFVVNQREEYVDNCQRHHYLDVGHIVLDYVPQAYAWRTDTFSGWGDWEANPGRSIDACWSGNPLYFDLVPTDYDPDYDSRTLMTSAEITGTEGDNGWYVSDVTVEIEKFYLWNDTLAPVTKAILTGDMGENGWATSEVAVELSAVDDISGVDATYYSVDGGAWQTYSEAFLISDEGMHEVVFYSIDGNGNRETNRTVEVNIDWSTPIVVIQLPDGYQFNSSTVVVELLCYDDLSGVWLCECSLDGGSWTICGEDNVVLQDLSDGNHTLNVTVYDRAGNFAQDTVWFSVKSDDTPPAGGNGTVSYFWHDMFNHPLGPWYDNRTLNYGDEWVITDEYPHMYIWTGEPIGNTQIKTFMLLDVNASELPGINMNDNPQFLPYLSGPYGERGGNAVLDWYMNYATFEECAGKLGSQALAYYDGWFVELNGTISLDEQASKTVLGITDAQFDDFDTWWTANGADVEAEWQEWMEYEASGERLCIYTAYEYYLDFVYFVIDGEKVGDEIVLTFDTISWGAEAFIFRWLREAFMPTEWYMEDMTMQATIGPDEANVAIEAAVGYALTASESIETGEPCWVWEAMLQDCVESTYNWPISAFDPYAEMEYFCRYPGNDWHHYVMPYDYTPAAWNLSANETLKIQWPDTELIFFVHDEESAVDPLDSDTLDILVDDVRVFMANVTCNYLQPGPSDLEDQIFIDTENRTIEFVGPIDSWTWSKDQTAHEWLADEWDRLGMLPYGIPFLEFRPDSDGPVPELVIQDVPSSVEEGEPFNFNVTIRDAVTGDPLTGYRGTVNFTSSDPAAVLPENYEYVAGDAGRHEFVVTFDTAGTHWLMAIDVVNSSLVDTISDILVVESPIRALYDMASEEEASVYYRIDSGDWQIYDAPFIISDDGMHVVERYSVDTDGDIEDIRSCEIKVDKTAPELVIGADDGAEFSANDVNITWTCSDACSGVDQLEYSLDGGEFSDCDNDGWILLANLDPGEHDILLKAYDEAGNVETDTLAFVVTPEETVDARDYTLAIGVAVVCIAAAIAVLLMYTLRRKRLGREPSE